MLLIFLPKTTPRHHYVFSHIFTFLGIEYRITNDAKEFSASDNLKFSYADAPLNNELHFHAAGLLGETEIKNFVPETGTYQSVITLFPHQQKASALPYDIFSAVFYLLSRYEEYLPFTPDAYGRFEAAQSIAYQHDFLQSPVADIWITQLADILKSAFTGLKITEKKFSFVPTYDIDNAYAYKHKGFFRSLGGLMKDSVSFKLKRYFERIGVLLHVKPDPFDTYEYQFQLQEKYKLKPIYFFHPGTYGSYDKNCAPENKNIRKLIQTIAGYAELGLHPSYLSTENPGLLASEIDKLEKASGKKITKARQHFIRIRFPETYRNYILHGITDDYSMGYATEAGFRAGTSEPFYFFDLQKNEETKLKIHPFVLMDGVYIQYHPAPAEEIAKKIMPLIAQVKALNGTFISLFHNNAFCDTPEMKHWRRIYEDMLKLLTE